jgi:hypothetical protein
MTSLREHLFHENKKASLLGFLKLRRMEHLDLIEDKELDLIIKTMEQAETRLEGFENDSERIYYLKNLMPVLLASSMLQAKAMFQRLESEDR